MPPTLLPQRVGWGKVAAASRSLGGWLVALGAAAALVTSVVGYFASQALGGTVGELIVIGATVILLAAALVLSLARALPRWLRVLLWAGVLIDAAGTFFCAWLLESQWLMAFMALALLGWLGHVTLGGGRAQGRPAHA